jgi:hypothetical protein
MEIGGCPSLPVPCLVARVGRNLIYGIFGREITKYTVKYGVYVRFWPTLLMAVL